MSDGGYKDIGEQVEALQEEEPQAAASGDGSEATTSAAAASSSAQSSGSDDDSDEEEAHNASIAAARRAGINVVEGTLCMSCQGTGTTKLMPTRIPFFREVIICAFKCDDCGFRSSEVMTSETQDRGCSFRLTVQSPEDLQRQVLKGDRATIKVPALDLEVPHTTMRGVFSTIEGILDNVASDLEREQPVRRAMDAAVADQIDAFVANVRLFQSGDASVLPFTFELDDPTGNSFLENPKAPARDPALHARFYRRTRAQNEFCGLNPDAVTNAGDEEAEGQAKGDGGSNTSMLVGSSARSKAGSKIAMDATDRSRATPGGITAASMLESEVQRFDTPCSNCGGDAQTRMCMTSIPHFKEAIIMALVCPHCGFKDVEVKGGGAVPPQGTVHTLKIDPETAAEDLRRDVLKSDTAAVDIPELGLEVEAGSMGGLYTTVEGLLGTMRERIVQSNPLQHAVGDSAGSSDAPERFREFVAKLEAAERGEMALTVVIRDPMANSWIYSPWDDAEGEAAGKLASAAGVRGAHLSMEAKGGQREVDRAAAEAGTEAAKDEGGEAETAESDAAAGSSATAPTSSSSPSSSSAATDAAAAAAVAAAASAASAGDPARKAGAACAAATGKDPRLTMEWYTRSEEEEIDLGIADMAVEGY